MRKSSMIKKHFTKGLLAASLTLAAGSFAADKLVEGKLTIAAESGTVTAPITLQEVDGLKMVVGAKSGGLAAYEFEVTEAGNYVIWGKVAGFDGNSDSFFLQVDDQAKGIWDIGSNKDGKPRWIKYVCRKDQAAKKRDGIVSLSAGKHKVEISSREARARLEALFIGKPGLKPEN
jgi:predicted lipoprotein with Yx(FWY)xxD motif